MDPLLYDLTTYVQNSLKNDIYHPYSSQWCAVFHAVMESVSQWTTVSVTMAGMETSVIKVCNSNSVSFSIQFVIVSVYNPNYFYVNISLYMYDMF